MGDRTRPERSNHINIYFYRKQKREEDHSSKYDIGRFIDQRLLGDAVDDLSSILYRPKTQEVKQTYEALLGFI
jgi:hypothetical protein